jgi:hypothetical protein
MNEDNLADIVIEIFDGVTVLESSFGPIYVKHFYQHDARKIELNKKIYAVEAKQRGLPTEEESLDELFKEGMWDIKKEREIQEKKKFIDNLKSSLTKISLPSQRENHKKLIELEEDKLRQTSVERESLIGLTAEKYADKRSQKDFFDKLLFLDKDFKNSVFENIEYNDLTKDIEVMDLQQSFFNRMCDANISRAVLSPYFSVYLSFAEDVIGMFGKPLKDLTSFQLKLISYSKTFLNIFKNTQKTIPEYVQKDPELLLEFYEAQKNEGGRQTKASQGSGGTTYFGARKDDLDIVKKSNEETVELSEELKKKGGKLDMKQMMEMHGL